MTTVYGLANCTVSVLRGTMLNEFGDVVDNVGVAASGIPASIIVRSKTITDKATQEPRVIQRVVGHVGSNVDVRGTDQLRDDTHGITYSVQAVTQSNGMGLVPDLELDLLRVT